MPPMNDTGMELTVGAVARLAGVTVRTMHHYDEIGLVSPGDRTDAGYRLYGRPEVTRLQEVLFFRELVRSWLFGLYFLALAAMASDMYRARPGPALSMFLVNLASATYIWPKPAWNSREHW